MKKSSRTFREIKQEAKKTLTANFRLCILLTLIVVGIHLAMWYLRTRYSATILLNVYAAGETDVGNFFSLTEEGIRFGLRFDLLDTVIASTITRSQMILFFLSQVLIFAVTAPVILAGSEIYYVLASGLKPGLKDIFKWYGDLRYSGRAMGLRFLLGLIQWGLLAAFAGIPITFLWWVSLSDGAAPGSAAGILLRALLVLMLLGMVLATMISWSFLPAHYILTTDPAVSVREAISRTNRFMRGRMVRFFLFRLSFALWYLLFLVTSGAAIFYVYPYLELASAGFVRDLAGESGESELREE